MTLSVSNFTCKVCKITFEGEYKPQQRPRKSCPKCHKMCEITKSKEKPETETRGSTTPPPPIHDTIEKLSGEDLEKRIVSALNTQPNNAQILGKAIEFFIKIKGKEEEIEGNIDMEALKQIGITSTSSK